jgi:mannose-6-phosphate isomerase-like protein (cupin superfamily)
MHRCTLTKQNVVVANPETGKTDGAQWLTARPGERFCIRVPAAATNGAYSVTEIVSSPGDSTSLHRHEREDEYVLVLEGTVRIVLGDKVLDATAGQTVEMKRGIAHGWGNPTEKPLRLLITATPGGCEEALVIISKGGEIDFSALTARFHVTQLGPPILG